MIRIHTSVRGALLLPALCVTVMGCASVQGLTPGTGSSITVRDRTYGEIWEAGVRAAETELSIADTNRSSGVIRATKGIGLFTYGEVVAVFINPAETDGNIHTVEVVSKPLFAAVAFPTDWEPRILSEVRRDLPGSTSDRVQHNSWQLTTATATYDGVFLERLKGDTLSVIVNGVELLISIDSIKQIREIKPSQFGRGAAIGLLTGAAVGGCIGFFSESTGMSDFLGPKRPVVPGLIIGGLAGCALGGAIGFAVGDDTEYNLAGKRRGERITVVRSILGADR